MPSKGCSRSDGDETTWRTHTHTHTHTGQVSAGELIGQGAGHQGEAAHLLVCLFVFFLPSLPVPRSD